MGLSIGELLTYFVDFVATDDENMHNAFSSSAFDKVVVQYSGMDPDSILITPALIKQLREQENPPKEKIFVSKASDNYFTVTLENYIRSQLRINFTDQAVDVIRFASQENLVVAKMLAMVARHIYAFNHNLITVADLGNMWCDHQGMMPDYEILVHMAAQQSPVGLEKLIDDACEMYEYTDRVHRIPDDYLTNIVRYPFHFIETERMTTVH